MKVKISSLTGSFEADGVSKLKVPGEKGHYTILPHHIDYTALVFPGVLAYIAQNGEEMYLAVEEGVFVKKGVDVFLSCRNLIIGEPGAQEKELKGTVRDKFETLDETEKKTRELISRMESDFVRRFLEMK